MSLSDARANKLLTNTATLLTLLPPTENVFMFHLRRTMYTTIIDRTVRVAKSDYPNTKD